MKSLFHCCVLLACSSGLSAASGQTARTDIGAGWEFRQVVPNRDTKASGTDSSLASGEWRKAVVPGDVHLDLLASKLIQDPFYRTNEAKLQWISQATWEYRTTFKVTEGLFTSGHLELVFDGIDTYAEVYLNGKRMLTADNMFRTWRVNVKEDLKLGQNDLRVVFPPSEQVAERIAQADPWYTRTGVKAHTYVRKAAYEYGWDWGPTFVTSGIYKVVHLDSWSYAKIRDLYIRQQDVSKDIAHLTAQIAVEADRPLDAVLAFKLGDQEIQQPARLHVGMNEITVPVDVNNPHLWWPVGYGAQTMYVATAQIRQGAKVLDDSMTSTGLRRIELRHDADQYGRKFEFVVNDVPIYAKGANVIPSDSFYNRVTSDKIRHMLQSARDSNMNMVRVWGGGYYEPDEFYHICDELGILIWHDFMFGNDWQPGTTDFKKSVQAESEDQLRRLRNHPSIALWSGNNETEEAFHWLGRDQLDQSTRLQMWQDYLSVFHGILATASARFAPDTPYWPSSPSSDLEPLSANFRSGDEHIWDVWHGRVPFSAYESHHARFVSEYGFQSFPELSTLESFTTSEDRLSIFTPVMLAHQKNDEGNDLIKFYMQRDYAAPKDFKHFIYMSQVLQAEGIKTGAEHLRRDRGRNMGGLYWQLNDCWPVASWSSIDSEGKWKALQYYAKRFYAPVLVSPHVENGSAVVYVVNDGISGVKGELLLKLETFDGVIVNERTIQVDVPPLASTTVLSLPFSELHALLKTQIDRTAKGADRLGNVFLTAALKVDGQSISENLTYLIPTKQIRLPVPKIKWEIKPAKDGFDIVLQSDVLARSVSLQTGNLAASHSDDYFDLLPRIEKTVHLDTTATLEELQKALEFVSIGDSVDYSATPEIPPVIAPHIDGK